MFGPWVLQILVFLFLLTFLAWGLGEYLALVFSGKKCLLSKVIGPVENFTYQLLGINSEEEMTAKGVLKQVFLLTLGSILFMLIWQWIQPCMPWASERVAAPSFLEALYTAISFATNTAVELPIEYNFVTRLLGFGVQNFLVVALTISIAVIFINGLLRDQKLGVGNLWVYLIRAFYYVLLPGAILLAVFLLSEGVPDTLRHAVDVQTLEGGRQTIALGPLASSEAIKTLAASGTNFFTVSSAHPFSNPTAMTDLVTVLAFMLIAAAFPFMFGALANNRKEGWMIYGTMLLLFILILGAILWAESKGIGLLSKLHLANVTSLEGKEVRFGGVSSSVFAAATTAISCGSTNATLASFTPLSQCCLLINLLLGGVIFGGAGTGFINLMFYLTLTAFLVALMIGRSPEIYGKKITTQDMLLVVVAIFLPAILHLVASVFTIINPAHNLTVATGNRALTEIFYTWASLLRNNGSSLVGIPLITPFYFICSMLLMLIGYLGPLGLALYFAGSFVEKKRSEVRVRDEMCGIAPAIVLAGIVIVVNLLAYLPFIALGPVIEHFMIV